MNYKQFLAEGWPTRFSDLLGNINNFTGGDIHRRDAKKLISQGSVKFLGKTFKNGKTYGAIQHHDGKTQTYFIGHGDLREGLDITYDEFITESHHVRTETYGNDADWMKTAKKLGYRIEKPATHSGLWKAHMTHKDSTGKKIETLQGHFDPKTYRGYLSIYRGLDVVKQ